MDKTLVGFDNVIATCFEVYKKKLKDYGVAWEVLRVSSLTDQLFIKTQRIRNIQDLGKQKVADSIRLDFIGVLNYAIIALIQHDNETIKAKFTPKLAIEKYHEQASKAKNLLQRKNHDYGEAWRQMRISSMTDLILMKINRIKQIEDNQGNTQVSEGIAANYYDIINYAVFTLIKIDNL